jgi:hypothetical protein
VFHQVLKQRKFTPGIIITFQVMAFAGMSPGHPDAVCAFTQGSQEKLGVHPSGTGDSNHPYVGWVFHPSNPCQVGSTVAAPVELHKKATILGSHSDIFLFSLE